MKTPYKLFLDDERTVSAIYPDADNDEYIIARSFNEAAAIIRSFDCPSFISFDNDLGEDQKEGYDFAKYLVDLDMDGVIKIPDNFTFHVHSANCKAWANISYYITNYLKQR